jgi:transcriptional regulator GlxA family with amidase domain
VDADQDLVCGRVASEGVVPLLSSLGHVSQAVEGKTMAGRFVRAQLVQDRECLAKGSLAVTSTAHGARVRLGVACHSITAHPFLDQRPLSPTRVAVFCRTPVSATAVLTGFVDRSHLTPAFGTASDSHRADINEPRMSLEARRGSRGGSHGLRWDLSAEVGRIRWEPVLSVVVAGGDSARVTSERIVALVLYDGCALLDWAGPVEVLNTATLVSGGHGYRCLLVSPHGDAVRTGGGVGVTVDAALTDLARSNVLVDTLLVAGGLAFEQIASDSEVIADLRRLASRSRRTTSVCTGALILAAAGLLDGYRATTHWSWCAELADNYPRVDVEPDRVYVSDRDRWTSAGVSAGTDLALALVEDDLGAEVAHQVAGWLVVFVRRPGGQAQFSTQLRAQPARSPAMVELQRWLPDNLRADLSVPGLAARVALSERHFARVFRREIGMTPAAFVEGLRVEAARRLLGSTDLTVAAVAAAVGIRHAETLHRAFRRRLGTTPDHYRQHFARAS